MHIDYLTLACLRDQLDRLLGARVQRVLLPDALSVGLELYVGERVHMLISAHPQQGRVLLTSHKLRRGVETETPLLLLMRKWVHRARLVDITQPPWERILTLHFDGRAGPCRLVIELIGRYSNVILVGPEGQVLEAIKRIGPSQNRYRVILPAHPYRFPPVPPGRYPPTEASESTLSALLHSSVLPDMPLYRWLTGQFLGISPTAGREIAARATGDPLARLEDVSPTTLAAAISELFAPVGGGDPSVPPPPWSPHVALNANGQVIAFAPYALHQYPRTEAVADIHTAIARFFQGQSPADPYAAVRHQVRELLEAAQGRILRMQERLQAQVRDPAEIAALRESGELLLTYQNRVPRGSREVTLPGQTDGEPRTISLDPARTATENAQQYFRRYRKAIRAAEELDNRIAALRPDIDYLDQLMADLALAESRPEIEAVRQALIEAGWASHPARARSGQVEGPRRFDVMGFVVLVGRNARQNEVLTFRLAAPSDLWLHVREGPGSHVIVRREGRDVPDDVLRQAASLAAYYSPMRDERRVAVVATERRFVHRASGARPGLVTYRNERTLWVAGLPPDATPETHL